MKSHLLQSFLFIFINCVSTNPQHPEINDQFEIVKPATMINHTITPASSTINPQTSQVSDENNEIFDGEFETTHKLTTDIVNVKQSSIFSQVYEILITPLMKLLEAPKINTVLRNIGTCVVNGMMEIIAHYLPPPIIPLIASIAGSIIPFEPVVMLRRRMPVTSYRRAFKKAMNGFMNTFDGYKFDKDDEDPYMTRRFNRRFINDASKEETTKTTDHDD